MSRNLATTLSKILHLWSRINIYCVKSWHIRYKSPLADTNLLRSAALYSLGPMQSPLLGVCRDASLYSLLTCSYLAASKNTLARAPGGSSSTSPLVVCSWWRPLMVTMILVEAARPLTSWSELRLRRPRPGQIRGQSPTHHKLTANC